MEKEQEQEALERALRIIGGRERLAEHLEVKPRIVDLWQIGVARIPQSMLLALIDILMDGAPPPAKKRATGARQFAVR